METLIEDCPAIAVNIIDGLKIRYCGKVLEALLIDKLPSRYGIEKLDLPI